MKKMAIIGANEFQLPLILKAKQLGFETHVFAWREGAVAESAADYFYPISIVEKDAILDICCQQGIDAVASIGSDLAVLTVNYIARRLGKPCNSEHSDHVSTNKYLMREAFQRAGIFTPRFERVKAGDMPITDFDYPVIVKPTDRSGSRGINKVEDVNMLKEAIQSACDQSFEKAAIVEEYISGNEYSAEGISYNGEYKLLAFTKKYTTGSPNFIETGHVQPSDLTNSEKSKAIEVISRAVKSLDIQWGASHAEFRITPAGEIAIIEIGARMAGDCIGSDLVEISTGYDYLHMVIDTAFGITPDFAKVSAPERAEVRFILNREDYERYVEIQSTDNTRLYRTGAIKYIPKQKVVDSSTRFGFYILRG